eukprot:g24947.t1
MSLVAITKEKIPGKLKGLKVNKSPELDRLHPRVLKEVAEEIVEALGMIFQGSLESGRSPEDWKIANVEELVMLRTWTDYRRTWDRLGERPKKWQMEYKMGNCEILHFGRKNRGIEYFLN